MCLPASSTGHWLFATLSFGPLDSPALQVPSIPPPCCEPHETCSPKQGHHLHSACEQGLSTVWLSIPSEMHPLERNGHLTEEGISVRPRASCPFLLIHAFSTMHFEEPVTRAALLSVLHADASRTQGKPHVWIVKARCAFRLLGSPLASYPSPLPSLA